MLEVLFPKDCNVGFGGLKEQVHHGNHSIKVTLSFGALVGMGQGAPLHGFR